MKDYIKEFSIDQSKKKLVEAINRRNFLKKLGTTVSGIGTLGPASIGSLAKSAIQQFIPGQKYRVFIWHENDEYWQTFDGAEMLKHVILSPSGFFTNKTQNVDTDGWNEEETEYYESIMDAGGIGPLGMLYAPQGSPLANKLEKMVELSQKWDRWNVKPGLEASAWLESVEKHGATKTLSQIETEILPKEIVKLERRTAADAELEKRLQQPKNDHGHKKSMDFARNAFRSRFDYAGGSEDDEYSIYKENTKDYIKEFGDDQTHKKIPIKFERPEMLKFESDINFNSNIKDDNLKSFTVETVLKYMNESIESTPPIKSIILEDQRKEITEKIQSHKLRPGFLSIFFIEDEKLNECKIGVNIDPTNSNNFIRMKSEVVHKFSYSYKDSLYQLFKEIKK